MKTRTSEYYVTASAKQMPFYGLADVCEETIEEVERRIDEARAQQAERGYEPEQFAILRVTVTNHLTDGGEWRKRTTREEFMKVYPC